MLALDGKSRKRNIRHVADRKESQSNQQRRPKALTPDGENTNKAPVICLTGLTPEEKDKYHDIIESLGGR